MNILSAPLNINIIITGYNVVDKNVIKRLYDLGLRQNSIVKVVMRGGKNACVIVECLGRTVALSHSLAEQISVGKV